MGIVQRLRRWIGGEPHADAALAAAAGLLDEAERLVRAGRGPQALEPARQALALLAEAGGQDDELEMRLGAAYCFCGELQPALRHARAAALARPYDVDARLTLGNVRLARGELDQAAHEFNAVIEEFGADPDAASGRRAVILARGEAPLDDLAAGGDDWRAAARLLTGLWSAAGLCGRRVAALRGAGADDGALALIEAARREAIEAT